MRTHKAYKISELATPWPKTNPCSVQVTLRMGFTVFVTFQVVLVVGTFDDGASTIAIVTGGLFDSSVDVPWEYISITLINPQLTINKTVWVSPHHSLLLHHIFFILSDIHLNMSDC